MGVAVVLIRQICLLDLRQSVGMTIKNRLSSALLPIPRAHCKAIQCLEQRMEEWRSQVPCLRSKHKLKWTKAAGRNCSTPSLKTRALTFQAYIHQRIVALALILSRLFPSDLFLTRTRQSLFCQRDFRILLAILKPTKMWGL